MTSIELTEFAETNLNEGALSYESATILWRNYSKQISIDFPSPKTDQQWILRPKGWAGQINIAPDIRLRLNPKVEIQNIFRMLEYAYQLKEFEILEGLIETESLDDLFARLAIELSRRVISRARKGFYRSYIQRSEELSYLRGRLNTPLLLISPWKVKLPCQYREHTANIEDNQILAWTLFLIARSGLCSINQRKIVNQAFRTLQNLVTIFPHAPKSCLNRQYHRLNDDYQSMHVLCRFLLSHSGPTHLYGDQQTPPFLIDMSKLYEMFVAEWLKVHLTEQYRIKPQEHVSVNYGDLSFYLDIVLYEHNSDNALCVLDTKYKSNNTASSSDIHQIVTYAKLKNCCKAYLIYPTELKNRLDVHIGDIHVRSLAFNLDRDLEESGKEFMDNLLSENLTRLKY